MPCQYCILQLLSFTPFCTTEVYDATTEIWYKLWKQVEKAADTGTANRSIKTQYWGAHQRFYREMCLGVKCPKLVELAKNALENGMCVVIGLQSTGEARMNDKVRILFGLYCSPQHRLVDLEYCRQP
jgi:hypothetical protein